MMIRDRRPARPTPGRVVRPHLVAMLAFATDIALTMSFLASMWARSISGWIIVALVAAACTGIWMATGLSAAASRPLRWIGRLCWLLLIGLYALWIYLAVTFGVLLACPISHDSTRTRRLSALALEWSSPED